MIIVPSHKMARGVESHKVTPQRIAQKASANALEDPASIFVRPWGHFIPDPWHGLLKRCFA